MAIIGFNFTKMLVERKEAPKGKINIKNNVEIKKVEKTDLHFGKNKQSGLKFEFEFVAEYEPAIGSIVLTGEVIDIQDEKRIEEVLKGWKKDKKLEPAVMSAILNTVLTKSNIQALILSRDINLPPPMPMPKVNVMPSAAPQAAPVKEERKEEKQAGKK